MLLIRSFLRASIFRSDQYKSRDKDGDQITEGQGAAKSNAEGKANESQNHSQEHNDDLSRLYFNRLEKYAGYEQAN